MSAFTLYCKDRNGAHAALTNHDDIDAAVAALTLVAAEFTANDYYIVVNADVPLIVRPLWPVAERDEVSAEDEGRELLDELHAYHEAVR